MDSLVELMPEFSDCIFFFQAEDGIRDIGVTGVQTCALPIYEQRVERAGHRLTFLSAGMTYRMVETSMSRARQPLSAARAAEGISQYIELTCTDQDRKSVV